MIKKNLIAPLIFSLGLGFQMNTACATQFEGVLVAINNNCNFNNLGEEYNTGCGQDSYGIECYISDQNYITFFNTFVTLTSGTCAAQSGTASQEPYGDGIYVSYCITAAALDTCLEQGYRDFNVTQYLGGERHGLGIIAMRPI